MAKRVLYCTKCGHGLVVDGDLPDACSKCGSVTWRSAKDPQAPYTLTLQDRAFLETIKIDPEE